jgi:membrane protein
LLVGSTAVFADLQQSLNQIWQVRSKPQRSTWKTLVGVRMRSFGIVLAVGFLLLVSMVFSALLNGFQNMISDQIQRVAWLWSLLNTMISFGIITMLFAMIYKYLPDVRIAWRDVMVGAAITSVLYSIGKYLIGYYLGTVAIASSYGAAGSFVILLIWIYYSALICFFGAEFTHVFAKWSGERIVPESYAENTLGPDSETFKSGDNGASSTEFRRARLGRRMKSPAALEKKSGGRKTGWVSDRKKSPMD